MIEAVAVDIGWCLWELRLIGREDIRRLGIQCVLRVATRHGIFEVEFITPIAKITVAVRVSPRMQANRVLNHEFRLTFGVTRWFNRRHDRLKEGTVQPTERMRSVDIRRCGQIERAISRVIVRANRSSGTGNPPPFPARAALSHCRDTERQASPS